MKKEREKERKRYFKSLTKICFDLESNKNQNLNNFSITLKKRDETKQINLILEDIAQMKVISNIHIYLIMRKYLLILICFRSLLVKKNAIVCV